MQSESIQPRTHRPSESPRSDRRPEDPARRSEESRRFRKTMKEGRDKPRGDTSGKASHGSRSTPGQAVGQPVGAQAGQVPGEYGYGAGRQQGQEGFGGNPHDGSLTAGMFAMQQAQFAVHHAAVQPDAATTANMAPALAELIARHVKQLLVPVENRATHAASREVMLTLSNDILPGTDLWLSRTPEGWKLRADTRSPESYRFLVEQTPELVKRFADGKLGTLEIDPALQA